MRRKEGGYRVREEMGEGEGGGVQEYLKEKQGEMRGVRRKRERREKQGMRRAEEEGGRREGGG